VWIERDTFEAVLDSIADRDDVQLSFDDGNASDLEYGLPSLSQRGLRATFYVVAGRLGKPGFLDTAGVRALAGAGMEIGCHGMGHRPWRGLTGDQLREELVGARTVLEEIVEAPIRKAACPFGSYDRRVLQALRAYGYAHVYTSDRGAALPDAWLQARNSVYRGEDVPMVERILASERRPDRALYRRAKRLVKRWR
jgi:peptidoglycan/xylan/chitin deacetylase (PgdA/CDA1 family)